MRSRRRAGLAVLVAVTTAGLLAAGVVTAQAGEQTAQAENGISWVGSGVSDRPDRGEPDLVTLITGDRVAVSADGEPCSVSADTDHRL